MHCTHRYRLKIPERAPSLSRHGAPIWGHSSFSHDQNNRDLSGAYVTCIYCSLSVKINVREMLHGAQRSCECILFAFVSMCVVGKNLNIPNRSSMADDAITQEMTKNDYTDLIYSSFVLQVYFTSSKR